MPSGWASLSALGGSGRLGTGPPRAARRALRRHRGRAGALPRGPEEAQGPSWGTAKRGTFTLPVVRLVGHRADVPPGLLGLNILDVLLAWRRYGTLVITPSPREGLGCHGTRYVRHARGWHACGGTYSSAPAPPCRTPHGASCPAPPVQHSTQEAGTRSPYAQYGGPGAWATCEQRLSPGVPMTSVMRLSWWM